MTTKMFFTEIKVTKLSMWITLIIGIAGLFVANYSHSISILIDTIYTIIAFLVYIFSLYAIKKLTLPPNDTYNYGYFKIESVVVLVQTLLIFATVILSITMAIIRLKHSETLVVAYDIALLYVSICVIVCFVMYIVVKNATNRVNSNILLADAHIWWVDGWISCSVLIGFLIAYISQRLGLTLIPQYADPVIAIIIAIAIMFEPLKLLKNSLKDLLDANPNLHYKVFCEKIVRKNLLDNPEIKFSKVKITKAGRKLFIDIGYIFPDIIHTNDLLELNKNIASSIEKKFPLVDVNFFIESKK